MSKAKHTEGPWTVEADPLNFGALIDVVGGGGYGPGKMNYRQLHISVRGYAKQKEQEANAHLISAAPDMLKALEAWKVLCDFEDNEPVHETEEDRLDWCAECSEKYNIAHNLMTAALAKAKGGE